MRGSVAVGVAWTLFFIAVFLLFFWAGVDRKSFQEAALVALGLLLLAVQWLWNLPSWVWMSLLGIFAIGAGLDGIARSIRLLANEVHLLRTPREPTEGELTERDWEENQRWYELGAKEEREKTENKFPFGARSSGKD